MTISVSQQDEGCSLSGSLLRSSALKLPEAAIPRGSENPASALQLPAAAVVRGSAGLASPWNASNKCDRLGFVTPFCTRSFSKNPFAKDAEDFASSASTSQSPLSYAYRPGHVWFNSPSNTAVDITPYSTIYGIHPRFFHFDEDGSMQLIQPPDLSGAGSTPTAGTRLAASGAFCTSPCASPCASLCASSSASGFGMGAFPNFDVSLNGAGSASAPVRSFRFTSSGPSRSFESHGSSSPCRPFDFEGRVGAAQQPLTVQQHQSMQARDVQLSDVGAAGSRQHGAPDLAGGNPYGTLGPRLHLGFPSPQLHAMQRPLHAARGNQCSQGIGPRIFGTACGSQSLPLWSSRRP